MGVVMSQEKLNPIINQSRQVTLGEFLITLWPEQRLEFYNALLSACFRWLNKIIKEENQINEK